MQSELLNEFYQYEDKTRRFNELWLLAGMRSSKTTLGGIISCYETYKLLDLESPWKYYGLLPDSQIFLINVATNDDQARDTVFRKTKERIDNSPYFQTAVTYKEIGNEFSFLEDLVIIRSAGSNSASIVGKTAKIVFFDELSRFQNTSGQRSGRLVYESLGSSVETFGIEGIKIAISSCQYTDDPFMQLREEAKKNPLAFVPEAIPTWDINPHLPFDSPTMTARRERNPEAFWRDFGCIPSAAVESLYKTPNLIVINENRANMAELELNAIVPGNYNYFMYIDPGAKHDSYAISIGHLEEERIIVDYIQRFTPISGKTVVDTSAVRHLLGELINLFGIIRYGSDVGVDSETEQYLNGFGSFVVHNVLKKEHEKLKARFYLKTIDICNFPYVVEELKGLRVRDGQAIEHPLGKHKDVADSVAGLVWLIEETEVKTKKSQQPTPLYVKTIRRDSYV